MDQIDHYQTASWGRGAAAVRYRTAQQELIGNGLYSDAIQTDIDNIQSSFGSKYDNAILEMISALPEGW